MNKTVVPQVKLDQDRADEQVAEFQEMQKNMQKLTTELNAKVDAYNAMGKVCQGLADTLKEIAEKNRSE